jgi:hypothetical protein
MCIERKMNIKHVGLGNLANTENREILEVYGLGAPSVVKSMRIHKGIVETGRF